jgi:hypothetical protein
MTETGEWDRGDGRIIGIGMHCVVEPHAANTVRTSIRASSVT